MNSENSKIEVSTINADDKVIESTWNSVEDFLEDWYSDDCSAPMLDDTLEYAKVCGKEVKGEHFIDVVRYLEQMTGMKL